jgi:alpha-ribazole phosphatase/probable phosphoglycerate mutase
MRHGEPVGGRKYRGQIDDALSDKGWAQMQAAVGDACPWTHIVASPLARCRAFAEALAARHGLPLAFEPRLMEVGFGVWEGHSAAEIEAKWPGDLAAFKADPVGARPVGAEPLAAFYARVAAGLDAVANTHAAHTLIVCHAGVIRMSLAWALAIPLANAYRVEVASAALTRLKLAANGASLVFHDGRL